jgi:flagellar protein FliO/FliZ
MSPLATYLVETLITLMAVVALAVLVLYGGRKLGLGRPVGPLELVGRLPIDARRAVYLVRVGELVYILGASEAGLTRLGEVDAESLALATPDKDAAPFAQILSRVRARAQKSPPSSSSVTPASSREAATESHDA